MFQPGIKLNHACAGISGIKTSRYITSGCLHQTPCILSAIQLPVCTAISGKCFNIWNDVEKSLYDTLGYWCFMNFSAIFMWRLKVIEISFLCKWGGGAINWKWKKNNNWERRFLLVIWGYLNWHFDVLNSCCTLTEICFTSLHCVQ